MIKTVFITLIAIFSVNVFCQSDTVYLKYDKNTFDDTLIYETDTFITEKSIATIPLIGTMVLPWTYNQQCAKGYGLYLEEVEIIECKNNGGLNPSDKEEVINIIETDSTMKIETKIIGNCCHDFLCDIEIYEEKKVNLIYLGYGNTYCSCECCYGLVYHFLKTDDNNFKKLESVMINGKGEYLMKK